MKPSRLKVHAMEEESRANGPGIRYTLWLQGCSIQCPGCFNPATHDPSAGVWMSIPSIVRHIQSSQAAIDGITISGGEPLDQALELADLLEAMKQEISLPILLFTGYTLDEISDDPDKETILNLVDAVIFGPYQRNNPSPSGFPGSTNKQILLITNAYTQKDFALVPAAEITITPSGELILSGTDPYKP
jgi:anaerobic ribonucleoside-triphosphate reductase activating protein